MPSLREERTSCTSMQSRKAGKKSINNVETQQTSYNEYESFEEEFSVQNIYHVEGNDPYKLILCVNNKEVEFEIDTGAGVSIISEDVYNSLFKQTPLKPSKTILQTYSGEHLDVQGELPVRVNHNKKMTDARFIVVKGHGSSLMGRDLLSKMQIDWQSVYKVCNNDDNVNKLLEQYNGLFSETLGKMKNFQAKLTLKKDAVPKFSKARNVPFALQEAVARLFRTGI